MRNLSRHAGPNRMMFLLLIPCLLLSALRAKAEETALPEGKRPGVTLQVEMDLVSSYIWRGVYEAGPSLQPGLTLGIGNFTIAAWGSVDFTSSSYKEADLMLSYRLKNITFHLKDLYDEGSASDRNPQISRNYFHFGADSPHRIEAGIEWQVSRKVPITLSWYTILFGARDVDTRGRRCYSSYVEVAYPFTVKTIDLKTGVGAAPWKTAGEGGAKGFAVKNVFINAGKLWAVKSMGSFRIGLFTHLSWGPPNLQITWVGGIARRINPKKTTHTPSRPPRTRFSVSYNYTSGHSLCGQDRQKNELIASQAPNSPQKQTLSFHKLNEIYYFLYFCMYFLQKTINPKTL